jgi:hypothetical protein
VIVLELHRLASDAGRPGRVRDVAQDLAGVLLDLGGVLGKRLGHLAHARFGHPVDIEWRLDDERRGLGADRFRQLQSMRDGLFRQDRAVGRNEDISIHAALPARACPPDRWAASGQQ